jgi:hypothetical protein
VAVSSNDVAVDLPKNFDSVTVSMVGKFIIVNSQAGFKLTWDGDQALYIKVSMVQRASGGSSEVSLRLDILIPLCPAGG